MHNTTKSLALSSISFALLLSGCGNEDDTKVNAPQPSPQLVTPEVEIPKQGDTQSPSAQATNSVTVAGITLEVTVRGALWPNAEFDIHLIQTGGSRVTAIRLWVGDESGVGSVKTRVHSHGASYHATAQAPSTLPEECALWIEVQNASGERETTFIALN